MALTDSFDDIVNDGCFDSDVTNSMQKILDFPTQIKKVDNIGR